MALPTSCLVGLHHFDDILNYLDQESPYDKDVIESLQKYLSDADTPLMQAHIDDCLKVLAAGFVDKKGAAYGFGNDSNNQTTITQGASLEKLDKFHTRS